MSAHVLCKLDKLMCVRHLFRSTRFTNITFFIGKDQRETERERERDIDRERERERER